MLLAIDNHTHASQLTEDQISYLATFILELKVHRDIANIMLLVLLMAVR